PTPVAVGRFITATATLNFNTSEFSKCVQVVACPSYPNGFIPFTQVDEKFIAGPDANGDRVIVGPSTLAALDTIRLSLPLPQFPNEQFCAEVMLAPGLLAVAYVPSAAERAGDFSSFRAPLIDPLIGQPFPNNVIPANRLGSIYAWRIKSFRLVSVDLALTKTTTTLLPGRGDDLSYTLRVDNSGPAAAANVTLTDAVPANTVFKSLSAAQGWSCAAPQPGGGGNISCGISVFPAGASAIFSLALTVNNDVPKDTLITNTARVTTATVDRDLNNNSSTAIARVRAPQVSTPRGAGVEIGPVDPLRKPSANPATGTFQIENSGNATLFLTPISILRVAPDADRFAHPADDRSI